MCTLVLYQGQWIWENVVIGIHYWTNGINIPKRIHCSGVIYFVLLPSHCRKSERKINFQQFKDALQYLADKKYPTERDPFQVLTSKILSGKGPSISGTTVCSVATRLWELTILKMKVITVFPFGFVCSESNQIWCCGENDRCVSIHWHAQGALWRDREGAWHGRAGFDGQGQRLHPCPGQRPGRLRGRLQKRRHIQQPKAAA